ncbi:putative ribonuclease H-like domain-containing protein [Tanacetum coccineum]
MLCNSLLSSSSQSKDTKDTDEVPGKGDDDLNDQERIDSSTKDVNTVGPSINTASEYINIGSPNINTASPIPNYSSIGAYDDEDVGAEADLNNLETTMNVSPIPTTRIHKDHPKDQIIGDINLATQTRRMTKISKEHVMRAFRKRGCYRNKERLERELYSRNMAKDWLPQGFILQDENELMDVKSAFLYGTIEEEVYVCQPPGFKDPQFPNKVYKVEKALYGLHQAPRDWYETLSTYLLENGYRRGTIDKTLFIKKDRGDIMLVQKFDFTTIKAASTPIETNKALNKDEEVEDVDVHLYRSMIRSLMYLKSSRPDIMFVVCACARPLDRKSTTGGCQFLGKRLISWQCKKQTIVANFTNEAEYIAVANCYGHVLWIQNQMLDYGFNFMNTKIHIDNESTICIVKNPVFHSKTKHIEIRHHFIKDSYEKKLIQVIKITRPIML